MHLSLARKPTNQGKAGIESGAKDRAPPGGDWDSFEDKKTRVLGKDFVKKKPSQESNHYKSRVLLFRIHASHGIAIISEQHALEGIMRDESI